MPQTLLPFVVALQFRLPTQLEKPYVLKGKLYPYPHRPTRFSFRLPTPDRPAVRAQKQPYGEQGGYLTESPEQKDIGRRWGNFRREVGVGRRGGRLDRVGVISDGHYRDMHTSSYLGTNRINMGKRREEDRGGQRRLDAKAYRAKGGWYVRNPGLPPTK